MDEERYEINSLLGKGRTGGVYAAEDTQMGRTVAVRRFYSASGDTSSVGWEDEFLAIAQNLGNLQDPNLLTVLDAGVDEDGAFLVAQMLEGKRLSEIVVITPLTEREAHEMASQLLDALAYSHEAGFIHGALTAGSIMRTERARGGYRYIIMDMGLSRLAPLIQGADSSYAMMADPALLAPELFDGEAATEVSDCYMLGHLIYLSLIGGHPFALKPIDTVKELHKSGALPPLTDYLEGISPAFIDWLSTLTDPDVTKRPQSATTALKTLPRLTPKLPPKKSAPPAPQAPAAKPQANAPVAMTMQAAAKQAPVVQPAASPPLPPVESSATIDEARAPQPKGKKKLILAICLPLLLIAGVCLAILLPRGNDTDAFYDENPDSRPVNVTLESPTERGNMTTLNSNAVEEGHSSLGCDVSDEGKIDWVVFQSPLPNWDKVSLPHSDLIREVSLIGEGSIKRRKVGNLIFSGSQKSKFRANLFASCPETGDGWRIKVVNKEEQSPLLLKLHFTSWNCDAKLRILSADGTTDLAPACIYKRDSKNTSFGTIQKLTTEQLKNHKSFLLELTMTEAKSKKTAGLSLNALVVE